MPPAPHRILVVDDNPAIHDDFVKILQRPHAAADADLEALETELFGPAVARGTLPEFTVDCASQGHEALAMLTAAIERGAPYAMAFVDGRMPPGWDGVETIERLWRVDPGLEVALCTAHADYSWEEISARLHHSAQLLIIKKPFDSIEIRQVASCLTAKRTLARQVQCRLDELQAAVVARTGELAAAHHRMALVLEAMSDGICALDVRGHVAFANPAAAAILGCAPSALAGAPFTERVHLPAALLSLDRIPTLGPTATTVRRADGTHVSVELVASRIEDGDRTVGTVVLFRDLSARHEAEATLRQSQQLADRANEAHRLADMRAGFAAMVTHELRTPLATIRAAASALDRYRDRMTADQFRQRTAKIAAEVERMTELVDSVLTLGRVEAGSATCRRERLDVAAFFRDAMARIEETSARTTTLVLESIGDRPDALVDPKLLRHIVDNLLANAVKYSPAGGTVRCEIETTPDGLGLRVRDQGIGIPQETCAHLFEPFRRGPNVGGIPGTGLGLVVTKRAVDLHGGTIAVESTLGVGTTVTVHLPAEEAKPCP